MSPPARRRFADTVGALRDLYELVRGPAALTVLGDTMAGANASATPLRGRRWALPLASVAFYWAGMALNDWSDRHLDAVERPERPIPSGRVSAEAALATGAALTAAGLLLAGFGGGRSALRVAFPLAASVWAYDGVLKRTVLAPLGMSTCRALDVLLGADGFRRPAAVAAGALGVHTWGVTALSAGEVHGTSAKTASVALAATAGAVGMAISGTARPAHRGAALAFGAGYTMTVARAQYRAFREPSAVRARAATAAGIHGMVPLQATLVARHGAIRLAALIAVALPVARRLARRVSPT